MLRSSMMDRPLLLKYLLWRAENIFGDKEIVTWTGTGLHRYTYREYGRRVRRLANALKSLGVQPGDRVGTIAWNTHRHFEAYFAVPCIGGILHTINLRFFPKQISYVINHAEDTILLIDPDQVPVVEELLPQLRTVRAFVVLGDSLPDTKLRPVYCYEELVAAVSEDIEFPDLDENTACGMCYTSATTGDPKGVLYSHRGMVLHSLMLAIHTSIGVSEDTCLLVITPMFHVNAWGMPYAAAMQGAKLVFPGPRPTPQTYIELIEKERVTCALGAVTVGIQIKEFLESAPRQYDLSSLKILWLGGQAPPRSLMEWFEERYGVYVPQGWGMTEASPLLTFAYVKSKFRGRGKEEVYRVRTSQGLPLPLVEIKVADDQGRPLPWDGKTVGEFMVRAPWVAGEYYNDPERTKEAFLDGWYRTGDMGTIDPDGYVRVLDRAKDMVKSGGEWISSVELENALMAHPKVLEATVVGVSHPKWLERPLAFVVPKDRDNPPSKEELIQFLLVRFPKWWVPDDFIIVPNIPKTGVGKFDKKVLRQQFAEYFASTD